jgi:hypothetical protein
MTLCAFFGSTRRARACSTPTPTACAPVDSARPRANATPTRAPAKLPGPVLTPMRDSMPAFTSGLRQDLFDHGRETFSVAAADLLGGLEHVIAAPHGDGAPGADGVYDEDGGGHAR